MTRELNDQEFARADPQPEAGEPPVQLGQPVATGDHLSTPESERSQPAGSVARADEDALSSGEPADKTITTQLSGPSPRGALAVWPALLVAALAIPVSVLVTGVALGIAMFVSLGTSVFQNPEALEQWLEGLTTTREGLLVLIVPGQLVFAGAAVAAALVSRQPLRQRLALTWGRLPIWTWPFFLLATPLIGALSSQLLSFVGDDLSEQLQMIDDMLRSQAQASPVLLILLVAVLPGMAEELLFRGYLQSRLLQSWSPRTAIFASAAIFAAAHIDPIHAAGVFPLGVWFGIVAWRAGSVLPAALCHAANNAFAVVATRYEDAELGIIGVDVATLAAAAIGVPAMVIALGVFSLLGKSGRGSESAG